MEMAVGSAEQEKAAFIESGGDAFLATFFDGDAAAAGVTGGGGEGAQDGGRIEFTESVERFEQ
jgi:hypothetical protein